MENREIGGWFDILGNVTMFANGFVAWQHGDTAERKKAGLSRMTTGLLWNIPNFIVARYGNQPVSEQFDRLQHKLAAHLEKEGVPLDVETLKKADAEKRRGWFQKAEDFLYNYPMEVNSAFLGVASLGMLRSGMIRYNAGEKAAGAGNIAVSALTIAAALTGILIPEKTDEQIAAQGHKGTFWGLLQKYPLHFANIGILAADATEGMNAYGEFKTARSLGKDNAFRNPAFMISALSATTMGLYLAGDSLMGFGSKKAAGKEEDRTAAQQELVKEAAHILGAQPKAMREKLVKNLAQYMVSQRELRMLDRDPAKLQQEILTLIQTQVATEKNTESCVSANAEQHKANATINGNIDNVPRETVKVGSHTTLAGVPEQIKIEREQNYGNS